MNKPNTAVQSRYSHPPRPTIIGSYAVLPDGCVLRREDGRMPRLTPEDREALVSR